MLTKEECEKALQSAEEKTTEIEDYNSIPTSKYCYIEDELSIFKQLTKEHFEPQPYKFEDLKPNMWVFDLKDAKCKKIESIYRDFNNNIIIISFDDYDEELFEENRFFPLTKALEYQNAE